MKTVIIRVINLTLLAMLLIFVWGVLRSWGIL